MSSPTTQSATSSFCPHCGHNLAHNHSYGQSFWEEAAELGFHFDLRHVRSLPLLLVPGELASRYVSAERGRYSPPLKIYVFVCILFFGVY